MEATRLGRTILRTYLHAKDMPTSAALTFVGASVKAGRTIEFANRIRRQKTLDHGRVCEFARFCGLDATDLILVALPTLKKCGIVDYRTEGAQVTHLEEYVGISAPLLQQTAAVWNEFSPPDEERCAIESVDLAAHSPLLLSDHEAALEAMGFGREERSRALAALDALQLINRAKVADLPEEIIYNEYIWGDAAVPVARYLKSVGGDERQVLTELSAKVMHHPGVPLGHVSSGVDTEMLRAAQKVGFLDAPRVVTRDNREQQFLFSPTLEGELAQRNSTDALHERKLFVAHILFGHHFARPGRGRIQDPLVLVRALLNRGEVGPASAIASDYPLLESFGIVRVRASSSSGRAYLQLVKRDVVEDGLELLRAALGTDDDGGDAEAGLSELWLPGSFIEPERERQKSPSLRPGPAKDLFDAGIERVREEVAREARGETLT